MQLVKTSVRDCKFFILTKHINYTILGTNFKFDDNNFKLKNKNNLIHVITRYITFSNNNFLYYIAIHII